MGGGMRGRVRVAQRLYRRRIATEAEDEGGYDRGTGGGGCSSKPIAMARPGVRQTLRSVSNNVNKRASILRFYRTALFICDNAPARARLARRSCSWGNGEGYREIRLRARRVVGGRPLHIIVAKRKRLSEARGK